VISLKDEIKEILNDMKIVVENNDDLFRLDLTLNKEEIKLLYDYITNLQERKITKEDVDKYFEENMCVSFDKFIENWNEQESWIKYYRKENERFKKDLKTLWNVCWNNDTEMTSYQNEIFDNYYDEFHKLNGGEE
jgi:hypothetical protein